MCVCSLSLKEGSSELSISDLTPSDFTYRDFTRRNLTHCDLIAILLLLRKTFTLEDSRLKSKE